MEKLLSLYQDLHAHPELSLKEEKTSARMAKELEALGLPVTRGVGGFGVVAVLQNGKGPTVLVRCDMDALPLVEKTGLPYASQTEAMHACGHDLHMTCLIGTAEALIEAKQNWKGTVVFIAQPAEEKGEGAKSMIEAGLFTRFPKPDFALALHADSQQPTGKIGYVPGYAFASVDSMDVVIHGRGGHGAFPHLAVDPIVIAAELVLALQTIVSREVKPHKSAVVTVGSIHGGTKHNIIPDEVKLELSLRSYEDEVRNQILEGVKRLATEIARAHRAPKDPEIRMTESIPSTYNDPKLVARLVPVLQKTFGQDQVVEKEPEMGGEDFALFGRAGILSFLFRLGSIPLEKFAESQKPGAEPLPSLHSSRYTPDPKPTIATGIKAMAVVVSELLKK